MEYSQIIHHHNNNSNADNEHEHTHTCTHTRTHTHTHTHTHTCTHSNNISNINIRTSTCSLSKYTMGCYSSGVSAALTSKLSLSCTLLDAVTDHVLLRNRCLSCLSVYSSYGVLLGISFNSRIGGFYRDNKLPMGI